MFEYITETDTFTSNFTRETFKINQCFDCNDTYLFYLITCKKCKKNNTIVKLQTTFVVDGTTTGLKVEVLKDEKRVCKNICTNILKVNVIQVSMKTFL